MSEKVAKTFRKPGKLKSGYLEAKGKEIRAGSRCKQSLWAGMRTDSWLSLSHGSGRTNAVLS